MADCGNVSAIRRSLRERQRVSRCARAPPGSARQAARRRRERSRRSRRLGAPRTANPAVPGARSGDRRLPRRDQRAHCLPGIAGLIGCPACAGGPADGQRSLGPLRLRATAGPEGQAVAPMSGSRPSAIGPTSSAARPTSKALLAQAAERSAGRRSRRLGQRQVFTRHGRRAARASSSGVAAGTCASFRPSSREMRCSSIWRMRFCRAAARWTRAGVRGRGASPGPWTPALHGRWPRGEAGRDHHRSVRGSVHACPSRRIGKRWSRISRSSWSRRPPRDPDRAGRVQEPHRRAARALRPYFDNAWYSMRPMGYDRAQGGGGEAGRAGEPPVPVGHRRRSGQEGARTARGAAAAAVHFALAVGEARPQPDHLGSLPQGRRPSERADRPPPTRSTTGSRRDAGSRSSAMLLELVRVDELLEAYRQPVPKSRLLQAGKANTEEVIRLLADNDYVRITAGRRATPTRWSRSSTSLWCATGRARGMDRRKAHRAARSASPSPRPRNDGRRSGKPDRGSADRMAARGGGKRSRTCRIWRRSLFRPAPRRSIACSGRKRLPCGARRSGAGLPRTAFASSRSRPPYSPQSRSTRSTSPGGKSRRRSRLSCRRRRGSCRP